MEHWEQFYASYPTPEDFESSKEKLKFFCKKHANSKIVLITVSLYRLSI